MKVLCPIDYSHASINACYWIAGILSDFEKSELHLCHFIHYYRRASMFISVDDVFMERAEKDMEELTKKLSTLYKNLSVNVTIYKANPKEGIVNIAKDKDYDLIVTGTNGLNALKNMTIGSVTRYIFDHSSVPILAVPEHTTLAKISKIALALDNNFLSKTSPILFLKDLAQKIKAEIHVVHVTEEEESIYEYDPAIDMIFRNIDFAYDRQTLQGNLADTLNNYCQQKNMDLLCMVHHQKGWLRRLFSKSVTASELFNLTVPLLVLPD